MIRIHKEGYRILIAFFLVLLTLDILIGLYVAPIVYWLALLLIVISVIFYGFIINFFRNPKRNTPNDDNLIIAPADGKVVVIEETEEIEYFKDRRIQVSIFMSPLNVHVNRTPIKGVVQYVKYHAGKYLVAWHPKSSTENERNTVVVKNDRVEILLRQIAGAVARRIVNYAKKDQSIKQGEEFGFIKFGSRVDVFLPLGTHIQVKIGEKVTSGETILAKIL